jgi:O-antigen/teichoic acid export membrane protein
MAIGSGLAQAIPLATMPLISRLYSPTDFGVLTTLVVIVSVLSVLATLRYELAIVLPKRNEDAQGLARLATMTAVALTVVSTLLALLMWPWIGQIESMRGLGLWLLAVPPITLVFTLGQIGSALANRHLEYANIARAGVLQQAVAAAAMLSAGLANGSVLGLVGGRLAGHASFLIAVRGRLREAFRLHPETSWNWAGMRRVARAYRRFPLFNAPYSLISTVSRDFPVLALVAFHEVAGAGLFGAARAILMAPGTFLTSALGAVFYREAASHCGTPQFQALMLSLLRAAAFALIPGFAFLALWGPDFFAFILGERWREAGSFAAVLAVPMGLASVTSWPERLFEVRGRQDLSFAIQVVFDTLTVGAVCLTLWWNGSAFEAIWMFAMVQTAYHLCFLAALCRLADISLGQYLEIVGLVIALGALSYSVGAGARTLGFSAMATITMHVCAVALVSGLGLAGLARRGSPAVSM